MSKKLKELGALGFMMQRAGCLNKVVLEPGPMVILGAGRNSGKTERMKFVKKIMKGGELILQNMQIGDFSGMIDGDEILQKNRILENLWQKLYLMDLNQLREISEKIKEYELEHKKI